MSKFYLQSSTFYLSISLFLLNPSFFGVSISHGPKKPEAQQVGASGNRIGFRWQLNTELANLISYFYLSFRRFRRAILASFLERILGRRFPMSGYYRLPCGTVPFRWPC